MKVRMNLSPLAIMRAVSHSVLQPWRRLGDSPERLPTRILHREAGLPGQSILSGRGIVRALFMYLVHTPNTDVALWNYTLVISCVLVNMV